MTHRSRALDLLGALALCVLVTSAPTSGQLVPAADWEVPRTPWGDPDLQGIWDSKSTTLMERPEQHADREFLTDEEIAALEAAREREASQGP